MPCEKVLQRNLQLFLMIRKRFENCWHYKSQIYEQFSFWQVFRGNKTTKTDKSPAAQGEPI